MTPPHTAPMGEQELIALADRLDNTLRRDEASLSIVAKFQIGCAIDALRAAASPRLAGREEIAAIYLAHEECRPGESHEQFLKSSQDAVRYDQESNTVKDALVFADAILSLLGPAPSESVGPHTIDHDGFTGEVIGRYVTREGKRGVVLQQVGTRVVHVYGEKWLKDAPPVTSQHSQAVDPKGGA